MSWRTLRFLTIDDPEIASRAIKNGLNKTTKGQLKWTGDYKSLQIFVDNNLAEFNGTWTTPRGGCKELKHPRLLLRWYSNTHSLILDGEEANNIQDKLLLLAHEDQEPLDECNINDENLDF